MRILFLSPHSDPHAKLGEPDAGGQCVYENELARELSEARIDPHADITYTWSKALAFAQRHEQILNLVGRGELSFHDIGIEPMVCTVARILADIPFSTGPGFYKYEHKGITGSPNGVTSFDVITALSAFGYGRDQYTVSDENVFDNDSLFMAGDFQTLLEFVKAMQDTKDVGTHTERLRKDIIGIETGSNMKVWLRADGKSDSLPRHTDIGFAYRLLRNGAAVHSRIFMKYLLTDGTDDKEWFVRACSLAESGKDTLINEKKTRYMYFPKVADEESVGTLWDTVSGRQVKWDDVALMDEPARAEIAASVYAGVAAELRFMLETIRAEKGISTIYLHDQFVSEENQPFKREILASMFGSGFTTFLADIPNASEMIALAAARVASGTDVQWDGEIKTLHLRPEYNLDGYYRKWEQLRDKVYNEPQLT